LYRNDETNIEFNSCRRIVNLAFPLQYIIYTFAFEIPELSGETIVKGSEFQMDLTYKLSPVNCVL